jgi:hypothetical protein
MDAERVAVKLAKRHQANAHADQLGPNVGGPHDDIYAAVAAAGIVPKIGVPWVGEILPADWRRSACSEDAHRFLAGLLRRLGPMTSSICRHEACGVAIDNTGHFV